MSNHLIMIPDRMEISFTRRECALYSEDKSLLSLEADCFSRIQERNFSMRINFLFCKLDYKMLILCQYGSQVHLAFYLTHKQS